MAMTRPAQDRTAQKPDPEWLDRHSGKFLSQIDLAHFWPIFLIAR